MAEEFELEHWKSRALVAEKERDSARSVLARLRGYCRRVEEFKTGHGDLASHTRSWCALREQLRVHDREHWNIEHAMNAVSESLDGIDRES